MTSQLDFFPTLEPPADFGRRGLAALIPPQVKCLEDKIMDAALNAFDHQFVVIQIQAGIPAQRACGIGGSTEPVYWETLGSKGIRFRVEGRELVIPWKFIEVRARAYKP